MPAHPRINQTLALHTGTVIASLSSTILGRINNIVSTKITPTSEEIRMAEEDFIVSKTDHRGKITYCNEIFIRFSGYEEADLISQPHNIIRHPDMPRSIYRFMWEVLQSKQEFFGIVKNLSKNGAYYWTYANVTPSFDEHSKLIGFYSVRRQPSPKILKLLEPIYQQMIAEEGRHNNSEKSMDASFKILTDFLAKQGLEYKEFIYSHA